MHKLFITICLLISGLPAISQGRITGFVRSTEGQPIEFVAVGLQGTTWGAVTDTTGFFQIKNVPYGQYEVFATAIGFESARQRVKLSPEQPEASLSFTLSETASYLDELVVSGTMKPVSKSESPVPVEVYSCHFFRANPTPSMFESLQNINGVRPQLNCNVCNTGDIRINGLEGPYTMVLIDGMPIVSGLATVYGLSGIPQSLIDRVEIVKGPASTLYGSEAVGGLINIITQTPEKAPIVSWDAFGTTWGEYNADLGFKWRISPRVQVLSGLNYFNYQNPIDNNADGITDVTLQHRISLFNKISWKRKDQKQFSLAGRYLYEDRWGGQMNWNRAFRAGDEVYGESIFTKRWELFGTYQLPVQEEVTLQISANGHDQNSAYGNMLYLAQQYIGFGQLTWHKPSAVGEWLMGAAFRYTFYDDNTPATEEANGMDNEPARMYLPGLFVQNEIALAPQHRLLMGVRYDYNSAHGNIFSPRINYKWASVNKNNVLRLSMGNGYRVANVFTEDHAALTGARQLVFEEALLPETSWNANLNFTKKIVTPNHTFIGLDATAFYTYFTNRIIADYDTDPNKIIYANLDGAAVSQGVSATVDASWENGLKMNVGATWMDVSFEEDGERLRQVLTERFSAVWSIGYAWERIGLHFDYTGNLYGPMRLPLLGELDDRPEYSPWWSLQNIQLTKHLGKKWEVYGGVKNLLNYTPPANSIARAFDPFDRGVVFGENGQVVPTPDNPNALTFDPTYMFAPNQGRRLFVGLRVAFQ